MENIAGPNTVLNTVVAEILREFADRLEGWSEFNSDLTSLIKQTFKAHKRIVFNGNNYSDEWVVEAEKRGLSNLRTTVDTLPEFISKKTIELFTKHGVFVQSELNSWYEILLERYCKTIRVEALTTVDMVKGEVVPACVNYQRDLT